MAFIPLGIMLLMLVGYTPLGWFLGVFMVGYGVGQSVAYVIGRFRH